MDVCDTANYVFQLICVATAKLLCICDKRTRLQTVSSLTSDLNETTVSGHDLNLFVLMGVEQIQLGMLIC